MAPSNLLELALSAPLVPTVIWVVLIVTVLLSLIPSPFQNFLRSMFLRGKTLQHRPAALPSKFTVPQSYFLHFYLLGAAFNSCILVVTLAYTRVKSSPSLNTLHKRDTQEDCKAMFLLVLFELQLLRRLYESIYISKFSDNARMHVLAYLLGLIYYVMAPLSIFPGAREIMIELGRWLYYENGGVENLAFEFNFREFLNSLLHIGWLHWIGAALFIWGSMHQHHCHRILAALRQDNGLSKLERRDYKIPYGDWFEYVSSAHYFAEIVIYFSFIVALAGQGLDVWLLFIFVVLNLSIAAQDTHKWYQSKFEDYPANRKAIIPFIY